MWNVLQDQSIMRQENLCIDINDLLKRNYPPDGMLGEALSGSVYQDNFAWFKDDSSRPQLLAPMISWFDRTHVTGNGRHTLQPYMMTSAIFSEKFRRLLKSWFIIGYMPKYEASSAEKVTLEQGQALCDYHKTNWSIPQVVHGIPNPPL